MFYSPAGQRTAEHAEIRHLPVPACKLQQTLDEPGRLSQRHSEKEFHGQAGRHGNVAVDRL